MLNGRKFSVQCIESFSFYFVFSFSSYFHFAYVPNGKNNSERKMLIFLKNKPKSDPDLLSTSNRLPTHRNLFTHSRQNRNQQFVTVVELGSNFFQQFWVMVAMQIISDLTSIVHQRQETFISNIDQGHFHPLDIGDFHVVGGRRHIFVFLAVEDVDADHVDFGVTVLAGFGGGHVNDLAGVSFHHDEAVLSEG